MCSEIVKKFRAKFTKTIARRHGFRIVGVNSTNSIELKITKR